MNKTLTAEQMLLDQLRLEQDNAQLSVLLNHIGRLVREGQEQALYGKQWYAVQVGNLLGLDTSALPQGKSPFS